MTFQINDYRLIRTAAAQAGEVIDYGIKMVGAPLEWGETMGEGVRVGIIDTGIDVDHIDLKHRIRDCANFSGGSREDVTDRNGHGTHVAGIVAAERNGVGVVGVAPKAELYIAKAFGDDGRTTYPAVRDSLLWMMEKRVDVINMSFSSSVSSREYAGLVSRVHTRGISMICAAGNEGEQGDNTIGFPANFAETIAVTAVDINKRIAEFSSTGRAAEIAAAGKDIYSTFPGGGYATLSGTSMATPIITGAVAILQGKGMLRYGRRLTPDEIRLLLNIYTEELGSKGRSHAYGYGLFSFGRFGASDFLSGADTASAYARRMPAPGLTELALAMLMSRM